MGKINKLLTYNRNAALAEAIKAQCQEWQALSIGTAHAGYGLEVLCA